MSLTRGIRKSLSEIFRAMSSEKKIAFGIERNREKMPTCNAFFAHRTVELLDCRFVFGIIAVRSRIREQKR